MNVVSLKTSQSPISGTKWVCMQEIANLGTTLAPVNIWSWSVALRHREETCNFFEGDDLQNVKQLYDESVLKGSDGGV
jgi:hypothetical protein